MFQTMMDDPGDGGGGHRAPGSDGFFLHVFELWRQGQGLQRIMRPRGGTPLRQYPPTITELADPLTIGQAYTLLGQDLGDGPGRVWLVIDRVSYDLVVLSWHSNAVQFEIPSDISGVPFGSHAGFYLRRNDGKTTSKAVGIDPISSIYFCSDFFSDNFNGDTSRYTPSGYSHSHRFTSAELPGSYQLWPVPSQVENQHRGCVTFWISDNASLSDGTVSLQANSDPVVDSNCVVIDTIVKDGSYGWDFQIEADFFILVPQGFDTAGWETNAPS